MQISDSVRFQPTLAVRFLCVRMIAAACWRSTYIRMLSILSQKRLISTLTCSWKHVILAQRIMDDIIDLESEKIEKILEKIDADPESLEVKQSERHLWEKIQKKTLQGRRTGVGITAEGDMIAALGLRYGTEEATVFAEKVQKMLALAAYRSSVEMAKERGAFDIYDAKREEKNPFY